MGRKGMKAFGILLWFFKIAIHTTAKNVCFETVSELRTFIKKKSSANGIVDSSPKKNVRIDCSLGVMKTTATLEAAQPRRDSEPMLSKLRGRGHRFAGSRKLEVHCDDKIENGKREIHGPVPKLKPHALLFCFEYIEEKLLAFKIE